MADMHIVSALKEKRIQVANLIEAFQDQLWQTTVNLDHLEAALRVFNRDGELRQRGGW